MFDWQIVAGASVGSSVAYSVGTDAYFEVPDRSSRLVVEGDWGCASPTCDLTLWVRPPQGPHREVSGPSPLSMDWPDPAPGARWYVAVGPSLEGGALLLADGTVRVRVAA